MPGGPRSVSTRHASSTGGQRARSDTAARASSSPCSPNLTVASAIGARTPCAPLSERTERRSAASSAGHGTSKRSLLTPEAPAKMPPCASGVRLSSGGGTPMSCTPPGASPKHSRISSIAGSSRPAVTRATRGSALVVSLAHNMNLDGGARLASCRDGRAPSWRSLRSRLTLRRQMREEDGSE